MVRSGWQTTLQRGPESRDNFRAHFCLHGRSRTDPSNPTHAQLVSIRNAHFYRWIHYFAADTRVPLYCVRYTEDRDPCSAVVYTVPVVILFRELGRMKSISFDLSKQMGNWIYYAFVPARHYAGGAGAVLYSCRPVSVCLYLCVTSRSFIETTERIELIFFARRFTLTIRCVLRKFNYLKNKDTSLWYFVPNSGL